MKKIILITGTRARVGYYLVKQFLQLDYHVIAHYRTPSPELLALAEHPSISLLQADFDDIEQISHLIEQISQHFSYLSAIIHNASCYATTSNDLDTALTQYQSYFNAHMRAPYLINTQLRCLLDKNPSPYADIIHITDIYASRPHPDYNIYCSTKAGLANLSMSLAKSYAPKIKVNCVAPGPIAFQVDHADSYQQSVLKTTPMQKMGGVEPIFKAIQSILDNDFMTGSTLTVDGGRSLIF